MLIDFKQKIKRQKITHEELDIYELFTENPDLDHHENFLGIENKVGRKKSSPLLPTDISRFNLKILLNQHFLLYVKNLLNIKNK